MSKPKTLKIDDVEYVRIDDVQPLDESKEPLRIVMNNDRGLCIVGNVDLSGAGEFVTIRNGRCVIRWGTSGHLAELADKGISPNTKLGHMFDHMIPRRSIGLVLNCNKENWA
jgi:hypothetical protein